MHVAIKVGLIWGGALLLALVFRAAIPPLPGLFVMGKTGGLVLPLNRLAFWACLMVGFLLGAVLVVKAMFRDLGFP